MEYLPTFGEKLLHSRGNVGKYSLHGACGNCSDRSSAFPFLLVTSWKPCIDIQGPLDFPWDFCSMVVEMVPLKGGIGSIVHPPIGSIYHVYITYILTFGGLYATHPTL